MTGMTFLRRDEALFLLLWSSGYIGAKLGVPLAGTFTLLFWRYAVVLGVVALIVTWRGEWRWPDAGTFLTGFWAHFVWLVAILKAFEFGIGAGAAALIAAMQPVLTALLAPIILGERNSAMQWAGIAVGFAGVVIFIGADSGVTGVTLWVYALPALATVSLTFITLWERWRTARQRVNTPPPMPIFTALFWQGALTAVLLLPLAQGFEGFAADWQAELVLAILWLAVVVSVLAYALMFRLIRTRDATRVSALQYFVPPTTMIIAWLVFDEVLSLNGMAGLLVTSAGFWLMARGARRVAATP
jgi:drug/metabolite transporter (DMT)-like permease